MTVYTNSRMFPFITKNHKRSGDTWNPLGGKCLHDCSYCWVKDLKQRYPNLRDKYSGKPRIYLKELKRIKKFTEKDFIFVCDCTDLFGHWVPKELIQQILDVIAKSTAKFLLLTKNPKRYLEFKIPVNCVCGATIESDIDYELTGPPVRERIKAMQQLQHPCMISIEPVMEFTPNFQALIFLIYPSFVAVGYDNYHNGLQEPELEDVEALIHGFENRGIKVYRKTLREKVRGDENK